MARKPTLTGKQESIQGGLYDLLMEAFPTRRTKTYDVFNVPWLAQRLELSREAIYKWLRADAIPYKWAKAICSIKNCQVTMRDFEPFLV